ncbi:MAG: HAD family hydrolase [Planctomycetes bacterium]|nr:HAD family hydrolase [Planctomycetota bacterium]
MPLTLEQYADFLDSNETPWPAAPAPERPKAKPHLIRMDDLKVVTWNIYGTLLAISTGELVFEHPDRFIRDLAFDKTVRQFNMWNFMSRKPGKPAEYMRQMYDKAMDEQRLAPSRKERYPEIHADRVWEAVLKKLLQKDYKFDTSFFGSLNEYSRKVAFFFHASQQGTAAEPGAGAALEFVRLCGLKQVLLADAQCFTMIQLDRALKAQIAINPMEPLFDASLQTLSFEKKSRKPSEKLFQSLLEKLEPLGIAPDQILHVGSRIEKDIAPARALGMRTALYAGDKESLQATPEQLKDPATRPDALVTDLKQIREIVVAPVSN